MRRFSIIVIFTFFVIPSFADAQTTSKPNLIGELILPGCSEYIRANLDSFFVELINNPNQKGYVLLNGKDGFEGQILTFKKIIFNRSNLRNFDSNRFEVIRGQNQKYGRVQFWSVSQNSDFRKSIKEFEATPITSKTQFHKGYADSTKDSKELETVRYDDAVETCDLGINLQDFASKISEDKSITGYVIIYNSKKRAKKIENFIIKELVDKYKVPKNRLKIIYGKKQEESEIELWFVPNGDKPPKPTN